MFYWWSSSLPLYRPQTCVFFLLASPQTSDLCVLDQFYWCSSSMPLDRPGTCLFLINSTDVLPPCLSIDLWHVCSWSTLLTFFFHASSQTSDLSVFDQFYWCSSMSLHRPGTCVFLINSIDIFPPYHHLRQFSIICLYLPLPLPHWSFQLLQFSLMPIFLLSD